MQNVHTSIVIIFFFFVHDDLEAVGQRYPFTLNLSPKWKDVFHASRPETALKKHDFRIL